MKNKFNKLLELEGKLKQLIEKPMFIKVVLYLAITLLAVALRYTLKDMQSSDMKYFLTGWMEQIKQAGGIAALGKEIGDYNVSYLWLLIIATYIQRIIPIENISIIKSISVCFDFVGAIYVALFMNKLLKDRKDKSIYVIFSYALALFLPTIFLNSAAWGQCDYIYTAFLIASLYYMYSDKVGLSFLAYGFSFAFKLQAIFVFPVLIYLYLKRKDISILHFLIIPLVNIMFCIPSVIAGRSLKSCLLIYVNQTGTYPDMTLSFPNMYNLMEFKGSQLATAAVIGTVVILALFYCYLLLKKYTLKKEDIISLAIITIGICTYCLPHMHERYAFALQVLLILYAILNRKYMLLFINEMVFFIIYWTVCIESAVPDLVMKGCSIVYLYVLITIFKLFLEKIKKNSVELLEEKNV